MSGPTIPVSQELHQSKYRVQGESFSERMSAIARTLSDNDAHKHQLNDILQDMRFLPAGRVQAAIGAARAVTPFNCFLSGTIPDSMDGIMKKAAEAAQTMRMGGGIGYDFSTLRPRGELIASLQSQASGPLSFMDVFDAVCKAIMSAGHRRGAQMGVLRVDHPDILSFVLAKQDTTSLKQFNLSVAVTDDFMRAVVANEPFDLKFKGKTYDTIDARGLWDEIMQGTWDWAEPGVLFIDRINEMNNLWYCETIAATNPCSEQPLPPNGACLLGSWNLVRYIRPTLLGYEFNWDQFRDDQAVVVRAMDNVVDAALYPLTEQKDEAFSKRRMGLGVAGLANAVESLGNTFRYGSPNFIAMTEAILKTVKVESYYASIELAKEKGSFPLFDRDQYCKGVFIQTLPQDVLENIYKHGIRNSHLTSIAPTGTISLCADNISSGIEPVFSYGYDRTIKTFDGESIERVTDYGARVFGVLGRTADQCSIDDHVGVLLATQKHVDSAVSKTCNVGANIGFEQFKDVYLKAWQGGAKGCTTFRAAGKRMGVLNATSSENEGAACFIDPATGRKTCE